MQRQSLGSPGSKHHHYHINAGSPRDDDDHVSSSNRRDSSSSSASSPTVAVPDAEEMKLEKAMMIRSGTSVRMERLVHVIPILTLFCFLVLYLVSHEPSDSVLSQFGGLNPALKPIEFGADSSTEIDDIGGYLEKEKMLGIRSLRNLQEIVKENPNPKPISHRKLGDF
ncbi:hypothetical protein Droror1_Dr00012107 [Drosera rotundifolia]